MKILLTGSTGFIGQEVTKRLSPTHTVVPFQSDLLDYAAVATEVARVNPDMIIHLAARTEVEKSFYEPMEFSAINYCGTVNLIEQAKDLPNLKLFLFSSTMETYGWQPEPWQALTEDTVQNPNAPYAVAKVGGEKYLQYAGRAYGLPYCILRQTNTYGRHDNDFFVVEQIITQMLGNPDEINLGYKEPYRNFLYIDDLIDLYATIVDNPTKAQGEVFVTGPANALTIEELTYMIAAKLRWQGSIHWNTKPKRVGEIYYLNSNPAKAKKLLGWEPKTDLSTGLDKAIALWKR